jgi:hypothetical protein
VTEVVFVLADVVGVPFEQAVNKSVSTAAIQQRDRIDVPFTRITGIFILGFPFCINHSKDQVKGLSSTEHTSSTFKEVLIPGKFVKNTKEKSFIVGSCLALWMHPLSWQEHCCF